MKFGGGSVIVWGAIKEDGTKILIYLIAGMSEDQMNIGLTQNIYKMNIKYNKKCIHILVLVKYCEGCGFLGILYVILHSVSNLYLL